MRNPTCVKTSQRGRHRVNRKGRKTQARSRGEQGRLEGKARPEAASSTLRSSETDEAVEVFQNS